VATLVAGCEGCDWGRAGAEAAAVRVLLDGRYARHLLLFRGAAPAEYRLALGPVRAGAHRLALLHDDALSAPAAGPPRIERAEVVVVPAGAPEHAALAHAPVIHPRPGTLAGFSDHPVLTWYETDATPRGARYRYTVVFTHEDGGTPTDRLLATWGRATDIELVYSIELDRAGRIVEETYQGKDHAYPPFQGQREGRHPLLWVVTENNMFGESGTTTERFAPAPLPARLEGTSREAVMDAHPWTYAVSHAEIRREGRVAADPEADSGRVVDPRRYVFLEACGEVDDATLAFSVDVTGPGGSLFEARSDAAGPTFRVARDGCFRAGAALPSAVAAEAPVRELRFRAFTRPPQEGEEPLPPGSGRAVLTRVNRVFRLGPDDRPLGNEFDWAGRADLPAEGAPLVLPVPAGRAAR
jgi:hypothetical protein